MVNPVNLMNVFTAQQAQSVADAANGLIQSNLAAAGTTNTTATALTGEINHVGSVSASSNDGVRLGGSASNPLSRQVVINRHATSALNVYPPVGGKIDALAANTAVSLSHGASATFYLINPTNGEYCGKY